MSIPTAILALVAIIVIIGFFGVYRSIAGEHLEDTACRQSVANAARMIALTPKIGSQPKLDCTTKIIELDSGSEGAAKLEIATQAYRCWDTLGQGIVRFLRPDTDEAYCVICARIGFKRPIMVADIADHLKTSHPEFFPYPKYSKQISGTAPLAIVYFAAAEKSDIDKHSEITLASASQKDYNAALIMYGYDNLKDLGCTRLEGQGYLSVFEENT